MEATLDGMKKNGVNFLFGKWLVEGSPYVLLFDLGSCFHRVNEWKADLWNIAGVPSPPEDHETNQAIVFGYLVSWFLGDVTSVDISLPRCRKHTNLAQRRTLNCSIPTLESQS
jgi:glycogen synthase